MDIGLSRAASLFRNQAHAQSAFAHAAQLRSAGPTDDPAESDRAAAAQDKPLDTQSPQALGDKDETDTEAQKGAEEAGKEEGKKASGELDEADKRVVESLQRRDKAVRAHEAAHLAAAGAYAAGGPSYTLEQGPDGRAYAIGGEVPIDMSAERTPEATLRKAQTVRAAAMAPADPSGADKAIAAAAAQMAQEAQAAMAEASAAVAEETDGADPAGPATEEVEAEDPSSASTEGFAELRKGRSEVEAESPKKVAAKRRSKISKAYIAVTQTPARATLRCASCSSFH